MKKYWAILKEKLSTNTLDFFVNTWANSLSNISPEEGLRSDLKEILDKDLAGIERDPQINYVAGYQMLSHIEPNYFLYSDNLYFLTTRLLERGGKKVNFGVRIEPQIFLEEIIGLEDYLEDFISNYFEFKNYLITELQLTPKEIEVIKTHKKEELVVIKEEGLYCISFKYNARTIQELKKVGINDFDIKKNMYTTKYQSFIVNLLDNNYFLSNYDLDGIRELEYESDY